MTDERLTISEAAQQIGVPRAALVRLHGEPTGHVAKWLGSSGSPPTIPASKLPALRAWAARRSTDPRFQPGALAQSLADGSDLDQVLTGQVGGDSSLSVTDDRSSMTGEISRGLTPAAEAAFERIVGRVVAEVVAQALPVPKDRMMLAEEVRTVLSGSIPKALRPVMKSPARWRESDVMKWIQSL